MNLPKTAGQKDLLAQRYAENVPGPVAFVDETYSVETHRTARFYVMSAVLVARTELRSLREALDEAVPSGWWHTTQELRKKNLAGARELLELLDPDREVCVITHQMQVDPTDKTGEEARKTCLQSLLTSLYRGTGGHHLPVRLVVMEERNERSLNSRDRHTVADVKSSGQVGTDLHVVATSPAAEHLLWVPDLVCSAYRRKLLSGRQDLYEAIEDITRVITLTPDTANPRLP